MSAHTGAPIRPLLNAATLIDQALACPCDEGAGAGLCSACDSRMRLIEALDIYYYEQISGEPWAQVLLRAKRMRTPEGSDEARRLEGLRGLGYSALGCGLEILAALCYWCWVLPRTAWRQYRGRSPQRAVTRQLRQLPVMIRSEARCLECGALLDAGAVRCPAHPQAEVSILLEDMSDATR